MFADLHIHSWYSDSTLSPGEIVKKAKSQDISLISVCDHEVTGAYRELENLCAENNIKLITGVETISVSDDKEYHLLAYGFDLQNKALNELLQYNHAILLDKGSRLIKEMEEDYRDISIEEFNKYERDRRNGGWKSIDYLKYKGLVSGLLDYFAFVRKYPVTLDKDFLSPAEVIKIIHEAGGYAVAAHLGDYDDKRNIEACKKRAAQFLKMGIDGFECYYPSHTDEITEFLVNFCREHDLMITAGSDEHGGFNNFPGECMYYIGEIRIKIEQLNLKNL
jgi:predicted metal-dependent phosphoesterase TrpH